MKLPEIRFTGDTHDRLPDQLKEEINQLIDSAIRSPSLLTHEYDASESNVNTAEIKFTSLEAYKYFLECVLSKLRALAPHIKFSKLSAEAIANTDESVAEHEMKHITTFAELGGNLEGSRVTFQLTYSFDQERNKNYDFELGFDHLEGDPVISILSALAPKRLSIPDIRYARYIFIENWNELKDDKKKLELISQTYEAKTKRSFNSVITEAKEHWSNRS